jgi:hypothetical protein
MSTLIYTVPRYSSEETDRKEAQRNASVTSTGSIKNGFKYVARKLKEHERQSQLAWESYYGFPTQTTKQSRPSQAARTESTSSTDSNASVSSPGAAKKAWNSVKQAAKAHHEAANAAYASYYGDNRVHSVRASEIKKHSVSY